MDQYRAPVSADPMPPTFQEVPPADAYTPPPIAAAGEPADLRWAGSPWELTGLSFINFLLSMVTLGIYSFWGKTEVRRRIWSSIRLQGEPFHYTGTGRELLLGFLFAFFVVFMPVLLATIAVAVIFGIENELALNVFSLLIQALFFLLMGIAIYRARRYRLSRTLWRGIRGGMSGKPKSFAWLWIWTSMLTWMTLGWFAPQRAIEVQKRLHTETTFGNQSFDFKGDAGPLYPVFAVLWVGCFILFFAVIGGIFAAIGFSSLGQVADGSFEGTRVQGIWILAILVGAFIVWSLLSSWYQARKLILFARYTTFDQGRFRLDVTGRGLIGLILTNLLITIFSLTILSPVVQARTLKYFVDRMAIDGTIDFAKVVQSQAALGQGGEGLAQAFDVDAF
mgnify:CR=1 FL=1